MELDNHRSRQRVVIIDYGRGNLFSIERAIKYAGGTVEITNDPEKIASAQKLVLPGVGAFGDAMRELEVNNLVAAIYEFVRTGRPLLGICLGMQMLLSESHEFGFHKGLDLIKGKVVRFQEAELGKDKFKIPNINWCRIQDIKAGGEGMTSGASWNNTILVGIEPGAYCYFVHSYICVPESKEDVLAESEYGRDRFCCVINRENIWGCQFHPERSGKVGLKIYQNFVRNTS